MNKKIYALAVCLMSTGTSLPVHDTFVNSTFMDLTAQAATPDKVKTPEEAKLYKTGFVGPYLAARKAATNGDVFDASEYFVRAHTVASENTDILEQALVYTIMAGDIQKALELSRELQKVNPESRIARLALMTEAFKNKDYTYILEDLEKHEKRDHSLNTVLTDLLEAWALAGQDKFQDAQKVLKPENTTERFFLLRVYHAALIYGVQGKHKEALALYEQLTPEKIGQGDLPLRVVQAWGRTLEKLDKPDEATTFYNKNLVNSSETGFLKQAQKRIENGTLPDPLVVYISGGATETLLGLASALADQQSTELALIYTQLAVYLEPNVDSVQLLLGDLLESMEQFERAATAFDRVLPESPLYRSAQVGRASAINQIEKNPDISLKIIENLAQKFPDDPNVLVAQGDLLRHAEKFDLAAQAYTQAVEAIEKIDETYWALFYTRGMSYERAGKWAQAEQDFKRALEMKPNQPLVLNYLGYSWIERGENLDKALEMVRKAVKLQPDDGYITDSLGWGLYKLGRYKEAVKYLQKAVELRAVDPVITDHYADALWRSGRKTEARFQWRRAISFEKDSEKKSVIKEKLESGLEPL